METRVSDWLGYSGLQLPWYSFWIVAAASGFVRPRLAF
jgi:hypothetical protein